MTHESSEPYCTDGKIFYGIEPEEFPGGDLLPRAIAFGLYESSSIAQALNLDLYAL